MASKYSRENALARSQSVTMAAFSSDVIGASVLKIRLADEKMSSTDAARVFDSVFIMLF